MRILTPRRPATTMIAGFAMFLSACGTPADERQAAPPAPETSAAAPTAHQPPAAPAAASTTPAAAGPTNSKGPDLTAYVGKYPFDMVDGVAFGDHPLVKAGIAATVTDARVLKAITTTQGPSAPIETIGGKIASWSCQQHKCGEHQWMILVDPATGATDVCYVNDPAMTGESRWFLAGGKQEKREGDCSSEKS